MGRGPAKPKQIISVDPEIKNLKGLLKLAGEFLSYADDHIPSDNSLKQPVKSLVAIINETLNPTENIKTSTSNE
jgi:hypothetical protein